MLIALKLRRGLALLGSACLGAGSLFPSTAIAATVASLSQITADLRDDGASLELRLSAPVKARGFALSKPNRFVVDVTRARLALREPAPHASSPVKALRVATRNDNSVRLVLQLDGGATAVLISSTDSITGEGLLRIDVRGAHRTQTSAPADEDIPGPASTATLAGARAAGTARVPAVVTAAHAPSGSGRDIVIAIDAGHGGDDPGASGRLGTQEKRITLAIAKALAERIDSLPGMRAILTRQSDSFVPLRDRTARARNSRADLFVSIHADAVRDRAVDGASVYTLSERGASSEAARFLADRENAADLKGVSLAGKSSSLASVLVDLSQSAAMGSSTEAAAVVLRALDGVGVVRKSVVQHAGFVVLKSPDMPSMLIETAYISNPTEEQKLRSSNYQQKLAGAIASGVADYFHDHPPDGTRIASERRAGRGVVLAARGP
jgi:N-acetylmuramoyl-L-alanine amidase